MARDQFSASMLFQFVIALAAASTRPPFERSREQARQQATDRVSIQTLFLLNF
jgi:hypothetical protein